MKLRLRTVFVALLFATILLYAVLGLTSTFAADDYCQAATARQYGLWESVAQTYNGWTGRFSQTFLSSALYLLLGRAAPTLSAILWLLVLGITAAWLWGRAGLLLAATFVAALGENVWQGVYWLPGGATYTVPLLLLLVLTRMEKMHVALALAFVIGGFNESAGLLVVLGGVLYRKPAVIAGALLGTGVDFLAPGNAVRAAFFEPQSVGETVLVTGVVLSRFLTGLLVMMPVPLLGALVAGMMRPAGFDRRIVILAMVALVIGVAPTLYLSGAVTPRILVLPTAAVIALCFHVGQVLGTWYTVSMQLQYAAVVLLLLGAVNFVGMAFADGRAFEEKAGVDAAAVQWVADCAAQM